jgi:hypothetical protein
MKLNTLIKKINKAIPEAKATPGVEFGEEYKDGIWFRGSEDYVKADGLSIFDYWAMDGPYMSMYVDGVHPKLNKIVEDAGWICEPHDSGTLFAWN